MVEVRDGFVDRRALQSPSAGAPPIDNGALSEAGLVAVMGKDLGSGIREAIFQNLRDLRVSIPTLALEQAIVRYVLDQRRA